MKDWRSWLLAVFLVCFGLVLIGRLFSVQILNHGFYKALAQGQQNVSSIGVGERGDIFAQDKDGNLYLLASNREVPYVFASVPQVEDPPQAAEQLSEILGLEKETVLKRLSQEGSLHAVIKRELTEEEVQALSEAGIPGIYVETVTKRFYPHGSLASHVIGFVNQEGRGQYGIEEYYDDTLRGKEGIKTLVRNPAAYLFSLLQDTAENGSDLTLTLDFNVQSAAESLLEGAVSTLSIEEGTVIVLDPQTGKLIALANTPSFDPNLYDEAEDLKIFQNPGIQKTYEPGSVFKPVTLAAALDTGAVTPETEYTDEGNVRVTDVTITNYDKRVYGRSTMTDVLKFSINTGTVFAQQEMGEKAFLEYVTKFGLFDRTGIDLAGEAFSRNRSFKQGYKANYATASFGQGIELTPLQMAQMYTAFAGEGGIVQPFLGERIIPARGEPYSARETEFSEPILSPKTVSQIAGMLTQVTEDGFAKGARVPGYFVGGKTGTAQVSWSALGISRSGYSEKTIQTFVGLVPAFDPQFVILVKLDNPKTLSAGYSATPIFQSLAQYLVHYYEIPPERE